MEEVDTYVVCLHNTDTQYITTHPVMYLCLEEERLPGTWVSKCWWEKMSLNLLVEYESSVRAVEA